MAEIVSLLPRTHLRTRRARPRLSATQWYQRGCELEAYSLEEACRAYARALAADPFHDQAHTNLGRLLHESGDLPSAESHYRLALLVADRAVYWFNLGVVLEDTGRLAEAIASYRRALGAEPELADAHYNLAGILERRGDMMGALRHLSAYRRLARKAV